MKELTGKELTCVAGGAGIVISAETTRSFDWAEFGVVTGSCAAGGALLGAVLAAVSNPIPTSGTMIASIVTGTVAAGGIGAIVDTIIQSRRDREVVL